jgi:hypothetical protein
MENGPEIMTILKRPLIRINMNKTEDGTRSGTRINIDKTLDYIIF